MYNRFFKACTMLLMPLVAAVVLIFFLTALSNMDEGKALEEKLQLENALKKSTVACYAIEGAYPPSIDYLIENYGIQINEARFIVKYEYQASNLMPDITVLDQRK